jgi:glutamine synthetase
MAEIERELRHYLEGEVEPRAALEWTREARAVTKGGVFSEGLIGTWIDWKRENEVDAVRLRPHPMEFSLYYDA